MRLSSHETSLLNKGRSTFSTRQTIGKDWRFGNSNLHACSGTVIAFKLEASLSLISSLMNSAVILSATKSGAKSGKGASSC